MAINVPMPNPIRPKNAVNSPRYQPIRFGISNRIMDIIPRIAIVINIVTIRIEKRKKPIEKLIVVKIKQSITPAIIKPIAILYGRGL